MADDAGDSLQSRVWRGAEIFLPEIGGGGCSRRTEWFAREPHKARSQSSARLAVKARVFKLTVHRGGLNEVVVRGRMAGPVSTENRFAVGGVLNLTGVGLSYNFSASGEPGAFRG